MFLPWLCTLVSGKESPAQNVPGEIQANEVLSFPELKMILKFVFRFVLSREYQGNKGGSSALIFEHRSFSALAEWR